MNFKELRLFGLYMGKEYAQEIFRLLVSYKTLSASEAASRLNLHIRTAQDFLEAMTTLHILKKEEVYEKKRPYYRYTLLSNSHQITINFDQLADKKNPDSILEQEIKEFSNSSAKFTTARNGNYFSNVTIWIGNNRNSEQRKINLTKAQGQFLYNLPFPDSEYMSITDIYKKAEIESEFLNEIIDIVTVLIEYKVIDKKN